MRFLIAHLVKIDCSEVFELSRSRCISTAHRGSSSVSYRYNQDSCDRELCSGNLRNQQEKNQDSTATFDASRGRTDSLLQRIEDSPRHSAPDETRAQESVQRRRLFVSPAPALYASELKLSFERNRDAFLNPVWAVLSGFIAPHL